MNRNLILTMAVAAMIILGACRKEPPAPEVDIAALRQAVQKKTEQLYLIHLKLDSVATEITAAEVKAASGECSDSEYLAAEAYRQLVQADEALIDLGQSLQELFNLDVERANNR